MGIYAIACVQISNNGIGKNGKLLYRIKKDLKMFQDLTAHQIVIMGRKTFESMNSKPLPNRINIVLTRSTLNIANVEVFDNFENSVLWAVDNFPNKNIYLIGGEKLYKKKVDGYFITEVNGEREADTFFPDVPMKVKYMGDWNKTKSGVEYRFIKYLPLN
jgi:dihydrofolate reductase